MSEQDPTALDPEPDELPAKPPITDPMPTDQELETEDEPGEEDLDVEPMTGEEADADETVDNTENEPDQ